MLNLCLCIQNLFCPFLHISVFNYIEHLDRVLESQLSLYTFSDFSVSHLTFQPISQLPVTFADLRSQLSVQNTHHFSADSQNRFDQSSVTPSQPSSSFCIVLNNEQRTFPSDNLFSQLVETIGLLDTRPRLRRSYLTLLILTQELNGTNKISLTR